MVSLDQVPARSFPVLTRTADLHFRTATASDAVSVAALHAESWRRHYRGAYSDPFLDDDADEDRLQVWAGRLARPAGARTILAEDGAGLVGFGHVAFDDDPQWGSLLDNLHVTFRCKRTGVGTRLLARCGQAVMEEADAPGMYLWVLEQNRDAQAFYRERGGTQEELVPVLPPGGVPGRLAGAPAAFRYVWPDPSRLLLWL